MYPKQPFDFAGRTGTIVFDVSDNSQGSHAAWPEFWMSDKPVPDPFTHEASWEALPQNGFGIRFAAECAANSGCGNCPVSPVVTVGIDSAITISNFVENDSFNGGNLQVINDKCVSEPTGPGQLNHFEIRVSQNQIDVYGTDAFSGTLNLTNTPLKHLATIPNVNLTFTRGLIWIEDAHYNGNKFNTQRTNTFTWDNVGFDGPVLPRDAAYDANDSLIPSSSLGQGGDPGNALGWFIQANSSQSITVPNIYQTSINNAAGALLTVNFSPQNPPITLNFSINGHHHTFAWPYPDTNGSTVRTIGIPIPLSDIQAGNNTVIFSTDSISSMIIANLDLVLVGGQGPTICIDPSNCSGSGITPQPTPTNGPTPSLNPPTPTPTQQPTPTPILDSATLSVTPASQKVQSGQIVSVTVNENSGASPVNALQTAITYPSNLLTETGISYGSTFGIKAAETIGNGTISVSRGSTTPATGNNPVATITFQANSSGLATIGLSSTQIFSSQTNQNIFTSSSNGTITIVAPTPTPNIKVGDLNGDGSVDLLDISILLSNWGQCNAAIAANLGVPCPISLQDLSVLLSHWGQ